MIRSDAARDGRANPGEITKGAGKEGRKDAGRASWLERSFPSLFSVGRTELIVFSRQMATFMRAGVPIIDGIRVVREQTGSRTFRRTLDAVVASLQEGELLSAALARHPAIFSRLYVDMIVAAEASGELDTILEQISRYLARGDATNKRVRQAMTYPALVLGLALIVVFILITFVLPSFARLFADFKAELPLPTRILLGLGSFGERYGLATAGVVVALGIAAYAVRNRGPIRRLRNRIVLRLPLVGGLVRLGIDSRFARMLGILLRAGEPIVDAFEIAAAGTGNEVYQRRLRPIREALLAGEGLTEPLMRSRLFGPLLLQMIKVGEETGTLDRYLEDAANFMDDDLEYRTSQMTTVIEPLMIVGVALMVGFVALSVVTPMYSILREIR
jgi:type IV pilus assembly protein PilC